MRKKSKYNRVILISIDALSKAHARPFSKYFNVEYENYRTTHSWTLPGHLVMLGGLELPGLYIVPNSSEFPKLKNFVAGLPTIAAIFKANGFKTKAITGGGFMSRFFGWGECWDEWVEADGPENEWKGEAVYPKEREFLFLHTFYLHNWFEDIPALKELFVNQRNRLDSDKSLITKNKRLIATEGLAAYKKRIRILAKRLSWVNRVDKKTLVVLTSDHGELFFEKDLSFHHGNFALNNEKVFEVPLFLKTSSNKKTKRKTVVYDFFLGKMIIDEVGLDYFDFNLELLRDSKEKIRRLEKQREELEKQIHRIKRKLASTRAELRIIKSSKIFRLYSLFRKVGEEGKNLLKFKH